MLSRIPIVLIHGFLGSPKDFDNVSSFLPNLEIFTPTLPGHVGTPFTPKFSDWMPNLDRMHLIGYSMGGRLALQWAKAFPQKIQTLTLLSTHTGLKFKSEKNSRLKADQIWAEKLQYSFEAFCKSWYDQDVFGGFRPNFETSKHDPQELAKTMLHYSLAHQKFIKPRNALFAVGEYDEKFKTLHPNAVIIERSYHRVHIENPKAVANLIKQRVLYEI